MKVLTFPIGDNPNVRLVCYLQESMMPGVKLPAAVLCIITVAFYYLGNKFADASDPRNHV